MNITALSYGAQIRLAKGLTTEARALASRLPPLNPSRLYVLASTGDSAAALATLRTAEASKAHPPSIRMARAYLMLAIRDTSAALDALGRAIDEGEVFPSYRSVLDPMYRPIWSSLRYRALLQRLGLGGVQLQLPVLRGR